MNKYSKHQVKLGKKRIGEYILGIVFSAWLLISDIIIFRCKMGRTPGFLVDYQPYSQPYKAFAAIFAAIIVGLGAATTAVIFFVSAVGVMTEVLIPIQKSIVRPMIPVIKHIKKTCRNIAGKEGRRIEKRADAKKKANL